jgi:hypothetical protein
MDLSRATKALVEDSITGLVKSYLKTPIVLIINLCEKSLNNHQAAFAGLLNPFSTANCGRGLPLYSVHTLSYYE